MSLGSSYDMDLLPPHDDSETHPEPLSPQPVHRRRLGHHAGSARQGQQRSRNPNLTAWGGATQNHPPHVPH